MTNRRFVPSEARLDQIPPREGPTTASEKSPLGLAPFPFPPKKNKNRTLRSPRVVNLPAYREIYRGSVGHWQSGKGRRGHEPPWRRVYIPCPDGKERNIGWKWAAFNWVKRPCPKSLPSGLPIQRLPLIVSPPIHSEHATAATRGQNTCSLQHVKRHERQRHGRSRTCGVRATQVTRTPKATWA